MVMSFVINKSNLTGITLKLEVIPFFIGQAKFLWKSKYLHSNQNHVLNNQAFYYIKPNKNILF